MKDTGTRIFEEIKEIIPGNGIIKPIRKNKCIVTEKGYINYSIIVELCEDSLHVCKKVLKLKEKLKEKYENKYVLSIKCKNGKEAKGKIRYQYPDGGAVNIFNMCGTKVMKDIVACIEKNSDEMQKSA